MKISDNTPLNCVKFKNDFFLNKLSEEDHRHLESCHECRVLMNSSESTSFDVTKFLPEYREFKPNWNGLRARIEANKESSGIFQPWHNTPLWQCFGNLALSLALLLIILSGFYFFPPAHSKLMIEQKKFVQNTAQKFVTFAEICQKASLSENSNN
ncbi:MAG: hypothetical protein EOM80_07000 [Erysipelotrichia bacterium]|nr:hypothetical protein [Erysipelotrichia bacterium]